MVFLTRMASLFPNFFRVIYYWTTSHVRRLVSFFFQNSLIIRYQTTRCIRRLLDASHSVPPCMALVEVNIAFTMPSDFAAKTIPGLVFCQTLRTSSGTQIVTYWKSLAYAETSWRTLAARLGINVSPTLATTTDARFENPWWFPISGFIASARFFSAIIIGFAAVFGAFSAIGDHFGEYFENAELSITYSNNAPPNVVEESPLNIPLRVLNRARTVRTKIESTDFRLVPKDRSSPEIKFDTNFKEIAAIVPGDAAELMLQSTAPIRKSDTVLEKWIIEGKLSASSGTWRRINEYRISRQPQVLLWPRLASTRPTPQMLKKPCESDCTFAGKVYVGESCVDLRGYVVLDDSRTALTQFVIYGEGVTDAVNGTIEGTPPTTKIRWRKGPVRAFSTLNYSFIVETNNKQKLGAQEWRDLKFVVVPPTSR
jgi:hypothetical protein